MRRRRAVAAAALLGAVLITGCAGTPSEEKPSTAPTEPQPSSTGEPQHEDIPEDLRPIPSATWSPADRDAVLAAAEAAMQAYARPQLSQDDWWADMEPLLNQQGRLDYAYVQPQSIPATAVIGSGKIIDDESALVATVTVPTDKGDYDVILNREDGKSPWLVARFTPPETAGN